LASETARIASFSNFVSDVFQSSFYEDLPQKILAATLSAFASYGINNYTSFVVPNPQQAARFTFISLFAGAAWGKITSQEIEGGLASKTNVTPTLTLLGLMGYGIYKLENPGPTITSFAISSVQAALAMLASYVIAPDSRHDYNGHKETAFWMIKAVYDETQSIAISTGIWSVIAWSLPHLIKLPHGNSEITLSNIATHALAVSCLYYATKALDQSLATPIYKRFVCQAISFTAFAQTAAWILKINPLTLPPLLQLLWLTAPSFLFIWDRRGRQKEITLDLESSSDVEPLDDLATEIEVTSIQKTVGYRMAQSAFKGLPRACIAVGFCMGTPYISRLLNTDVSASGIHVFALSVLFSTASFLLNEVQRTPKYSYQAVWLTALAKFSANTFAPELSPWETFAKTYSVACSCLIAAHFTAKVIESLASSTQFRFARKTSSQIVL
jgi:hypothetical protein